MRIAYFVDGFPRISETFVLAQITGMIDRGHDVRIFTNHLITPDVQHKSVMQYRLLEKTTVVPWVSNKTLKRLKPAARGLVEATKRGRTGAALRALNFVRFGRKALGLSTLIRATGNFEPVSFDVIHCQFGQLGVVAEELRQCRAITGSLVTSFRGADAMKYASEDPARFSTLFANGSRFLAVSDAIRNRLIQIGCPEDRISVLRSGIDLRRFERRQDRTPGDSVNLISVGRLAPNKGIEVALSAIRILLDAGIDLHYRVVGTGPQLAELQQQTAALGIESAVTFEGALDSDGVIDALNQSDILLAPTTSGLHGDQEGLPNCLKEAMAVGVVAIGTNMGSIPELVADGVNGYLVEQRDAEALAAAVQSALADWKSSARMIGEARRRVESEYDIEKLNDDLEKLYKGSVEQL
jgi:colanic acid/amylovoran biosynthesis glycosyltransferase